MNHVRRMRLAGTLVAAALAVPAASAAQSVPQTPQTATAMTMSDHLPATLDD